MSSRRDAERERERDRSSRTQQQASQIRTNEYFVPKEGIDREVITADICRYLGNDALVRPGTYENPQTRQVQQGYFINAYRNLTTAMIADLKADSDRWDAERRQTASRGQPSNVEYRASTTHQSRQYYGPTEATASAASGYPAASAGGQSGYDSYQQPAYNQPQYSSTSQAYSDNGYPAYIATGAEMAVERSGSAIRQPNQPAVSNQGIPRQYAASTPGYSQQPDPRAAYYPNQPAVSSSQGYPTQQQPVYDYGRAGVSYGDSTPDYSDRYAESTSYTQAPVSSTSSTAAPSSRRDRGDREDRDRHSSRRHGR